MTRTRTWRTWTSPRASLYTLCSSALLMVLSEHLEVVLEVVMVELHCMNSKRRQRRSTTWTAARSAATYPR